MNHHDTLQRFVEAQQKDYPIALSEIKNSRKQSHWMWYIFPQIQGLGVSSTSKYYAIKNADEAMAYLAHPVLGKRLVEISEVLVSLNNDNATQIFGKPDDLKLRSSMTLFSCLPGANPIFQSVLNKFFQGVKDDQTLRILASH